MSFLFIDGFDVYPDIDVTAQGLQACWVFQNNAAFGSMSIVAGRFGGQAVETQAAGAVNSTAFGQPVASGQTFAAGFAFQLATPNPNNVYPILGFLTANGVTPPIADVAINQNQQLCLRVGGTVVATAPAILADGSWHYIEVELTIGSSATMNLYMDGFEVATFTGNTGGAADCTFVAFMPGNSSAGGTGNVLTCLFDDVYVKNIATREGERRVQTLVPSSNSAVQWTPLANTNWQEVSELPVDGDTSYVSSSTVNNQDLYGITSLAGTPTAISAVQVRTCARKDNSATTTLCSVLSSSGTVADGATYAVTGSYGYQRDIYATDPHTSAAWTGSGVDAALIGQKLLS